MRYTILLLALLCLSLFGCQSRRAPAEAEAPATPPATLSSKTASTFLTKPAPSATYSAASIYETFAASSDTFLRLPQHIYHLYWQVRLDTLQPLIHVTPPVPAKHFLGDTSRGFQGYYTVDVRDSLGQRVGHHVFSKADFYSAVGPELAISSYAELPDLLGYSQSLGGLVFTVPFNAPGTDWYGQAVLILDPSGRVRNISDGRYSDGSPDLIPTLSHDGRTLLTGSTIQYAGRSPLLLHRTGAELCGAMLLNDTLALTIYEPGLVRTMPSGLPYVEASAAQRRQPNAFVRDVRNGREVSRFRYDGFYGELSYVVPLQILPHSEAVYLLDAAKGLYVLPLRHPDSVQYIPFRHLPRYQVPKRSTEVCFELSGETTQYRFYLDTLTGYLRYQPIIFK